jgi:hypothetical protein
MLAWVTLLGFAPPIYGLQVPNDVEKGSKDAANAFGPTALTDHPDEIFILSILDLGLFDLAIETCQSRLQLAGGVQTDAGAQWAMLAMQAMSAKIAADPELLEKPETLSKRMQIVRDVASPKEETPRLLWLQYKLQWCRWYILRRMLASYLAVPARTNIRDSALATIRECADDLEKLQSLIQKAPGRTANATSKSKQSPNQWIGLINDTHLLYADLLLLRAWAYAPDSAERQEAAAEMLAALDKSASRISSDWPDRPSFELARCSAMIHLGREADAVKELLSIKQRLDSPSEGRPKPANRWGRRIACLMAEALREQGKIDESNHWIESSGGWSAAPELALETFANLVAGSRDDKNDTQLAEALRIKSEIGKRFGFYWQQRADAILVSNRFSTDTNSEPPSTNTVPSTSTNIKVEVLMAEAKQLLAAKKWESAIDKLSQAELVASKNNNATTPLNIALASAAILDKLGRKDQANAELHRAAIAYRTAPNAPDVALQSVWVPPQGINASPDKRNDPAELEAVEIQRAIYRGRLTDIIATWPDSSQAQKALIRLDQFLLANDQLAALLQTWDDRLTHDTSEPITSPIESSEITTLDQCIARYALVCVATQGAWLSDAPLTEAEKSAIASQLDRIEQHIIEKSQAERKLSLRAYLASIRLGERWPTADQWSLAQPPQQSVGPILHTWGAAADANAKQLRDYKTDAITYLAMLWTRTESEFRQTLEGGLSKPIDPKRVAKLNSAYAELKTLRDDRNQNTLEILAEPVRQAFERDIALYDAALRCWTGSEETGVSSLLSPQASETRNSWRLFRSARVLQTLPSQRKKAIELFKQLGRGVSPGSEQWLESRARMIQSMRLMGDSKGAQELASLIHATYPAMSAEWKSRLAQ